MITSKNTNIPIVSLEFINKESPYKVTYYNKREEILHFSTSKGLEYVITFVLDKTLNIPNMYQLVVEEIYQTHASYDPLIEKTIIAIIESFLDKEYNILAFVCDSSDKHEKARNYLFNKWYLKYDNNRFYKWDGMIHTEENTYYSSLICNKKHMDYLSIKCLFYNFVSELQK